MLWYYYDKKGVRLGPITSDELKHAANNGTIDPNTLLECHKDGKIFKDRASKVPDLFGQNLPAEVASENAITVKRTAIESVTSFGVPVVSAFSSLVESAASFVLPRRDSDEFRRKVAELLGDTIMDTRGGVSFSCVIDLDYNLKLPPQFQPGTLDIFLHERGIRFQQNKLIVFALPFKQITNVDKVNTTAEKKGSVTRIAKGSAVGFASMSLVGLGALGAAAGAVYGAISRKANKTFLRFEYTNEGNTESFLAESDIASSDLFVERLSEHLRY